MTVTPLPYPAPAVIDATADVFVAIACEARKEPHRRLESLPVTGRIVAQTTAARLLTPATPLLAAQVAQALASTLDDEGHHSAATLLTRTAAAWTAQAARGL